MTTNFHAAARDFQLSEHQIEAVVRLAQQKHMDLNSIFVDSHEFQMTIGEVRTGLFICIDLPRNLDHSISIVTNGKWNI